MLLQIWVLPTAESQTAASEGIVQSGAVTVSPPSGTRTFLESCPPDITLEQLCARLSTRHNRIYPDRAALEIEKLQDGYNLDLDLAYVVGDVLKDRDSGTPVSSIVKVIQACSTHESPVPPQSTLRPRSHSFGVNRRKRPRDAGLVDGWSSPEPFIKPELEGPLPSKPEGRRSTKKRRLHEVQRSLSPDSNEADEPLPSHEVDERPSAVEPGNDSAIGLPTLPDTSAYHAAIQDSQPPGFNDLTTLREPTKEPQPNHATTPASPILGGPRLDIINDSLIGLEESGKSASHPYAPIVDKEGARSDTKTTLAKPSKDTSLSTPPKVARKGQPNENVTRRRSLRRKASSTALSADKPKPSEFPDDPIETDADDNNDRPQLGLQDGKRKPAGANISKQTERPLVQTLLKTGYVRRQDTDTDGPGGEADKIPDKQDAKDETIPQTPISGRDVVEREPPVKENKQQDAATKQKKRAAPPDQNGHLDLGPKKSRRKEQRNDSVGRVEEDDDVHEPSKSKSASFHSDIGGTKSADDKEGDNITSEGEAAIDLMRNAIADAEKEAKGKAADQIAKEKEAEKKAELEELEAVERQIQEKANLVSKAWEVKVASETTPKRPATPTKPWPLKGGEQTRAKTHPLLSNSANEQQSVKQQKKVGRAAATSGAPELPVTRSYKRTVSFVDEVQPMDQEGGAPGGSGGGDSEEKTIRPEGGATRPSIQHPQEKGAAPQPNSRTRSARRAEEPTDRADKSTDRECGAARKETPIFPPGMGPEDLEPQPDAAASTVSHVTRRRAAKQTQLKDEIIGKKAVSAADKPQPKKATLRSARGKDKAAQRAAAEPAPPPPPPAAKRASTIEIVISTDEEKSVSSYYASEDEPADAVPSKAATAKRPELEGKGAKGDAGGDRNTSGKKNSLGKTADSLVAGSDRRPLTLSDRESTAVQEPAPAAESVMAQPPVRYSSSPAPSDRSSSRSPVRYLSRTPSIGSFNQGDSGHGSQLTLSGHAKQSTPSISEQEGHVTEGDLNDRGAEKPRSGQLPDNKTDTETGEDEEEEEVSSPSESDDDLVAKLTGARNIDHSEGQAATATVRSPNHDARALEKSLQYHALQTTDPSSASCHAAADLQAQPLASPSPVAEKDERKSLGQQHRQQLKQQRHTAAADATTRSEAATLRSPQKPPHAHAGATPRATAAFSGTPPSGQAAWRARNGGSTSTPVYGSQLSSQLQDMLLRSTVATATAAPNQKRQQPLRGADMESSDDDEDTDESSEEEEDTKKRASTTGAGPKSKRADAAARKSNRQLSPALSASSTSSSSSSSSLSSAFNGKDFRKPPTKTYQRTRQQKASVRDRSMKRPSLEPGADADDAKDGAGTDDGGGGGGGGGGGKQTPSPTQQSRNLQTQTDADAESLNSMSQNPKKRSRGRRKSKGGSGGGGEKGTKVASRLSGLLNSVWPGFASSSQAR